MPGVRRKIKELPAWIRGNSGFSTHYGGLVYLTGENASRGAEKDNTFRSGAIANVKAFIDAVRADKPINNAGQAVESNLTAILGRMAHMSRA
jgi:hypothetical protein